MALRTMPEPFQRRESAMGTEGDRNTGLRGKGRASNAPGRAERRQRLAEALRVNLQKRKDQTRSRQAAASGRQPPEKS